MTWTTCITCGEPSPRRYCAEHTRHAPKQSASQRGYDARWQRLSKQARRLTPWCADCGTSDDLTGDHLRWPARTLADVEVVCRSCNSKRGASRGDNVRR